MFYISVQLNISDADDVFKEKYLGQNIKWPSGNNVPLFEMYNAIKQSCVNSKQTNQHTIGFIQS